MGKNHASQYANFGSLRNNLPCSTLSTLTKTFSSPLITILIALNKYSLILSITPCTYNFINIIIIQNGM